MAKLSVVDLQKNHKVVVGNTVIYGLDKQKLTTQYTDKSKLKPKGPAAASSGGSKSASSSTSDYDRYRFVFNFHGGLKGKTLELDPVGDQDPAQIEIPVIVEALKAYIQEKSIPSDQPITFALKACFGGDSQFQVELVRKIRDSGIQQPICLTARPEVLTTVTRGKAKSVFQSLQIKHATSFDKHWTGGHRNCVIIAQGMNSEQRIHDPTDRLHLDPHDPLFCASSIEANCKRLNAVNILPFQRKTSIENIAILVMKGRAVSQEQVKMVRKQAEGEKDSLDPGVLAFIRSTGFKASSQKKQDDFSVFLKKTAGLQDLVKYKDFLGKAIEENTNVKEVVYRFRKSLKKGFSFANYDEVQLYFKKNLIQQPKYLKALLAIEVMQYGGLPADELGKMVKDLPNLLGAGKKKRQKAQGADFEYGMLARLATSENARAFRVLLQHSLSSAKSSAIVKGPVEKDIFFKQGERLRLAMELAAASNSPHICRVATMLLDDATQQYSEEQLCRVWLGLQAKMELNGTKTQALWKVVEKASKGSKNAALKQDGDDLSTDQQQQGPTTAQEKEIADKEKQQQAERDKEIKEQESKLLQGYRRELAKIRGQIATKENQKARGEGGSYRKTYLGGWITTSMNTDKAKRKHEKLKNAESQLKSKIQDAEKNKLVLQAIPILAEQFGKPQLQKMLKESVQAVFMGKLKSPDDPDDLNQGQRRDNIGTFLKETREGKKVYLAGRNELGRHPLPNNKGAAKKGASGEAGAKKGASGGISYGKLAVYICLVLPAILDVLVTLVTVFFGKPFPILNSWVKTGGDTSKKTGLHEPLLRQEGSTPSSGFNRDGSSVEAEVKHPLMEERDFQPESKKKKKGAGRPR